VALCILIESEGSERVVLNCLYNINFTGKQRRVELRVMCRFTLISLVKINKSMKHLAYVGGVEISGSDFITICS